MKTSELTSPALDWAVAKCEGLEPFTDGVSWIADIAGTYQQLPKYSTAWAHGGPIIEGEQLDVAFDRDWKYEPTDPDDNGDRWYATLHGSTDLDTPLWSYYGPTPLIAAMRCFVASKLGDEVDVPEELMP
jgi:hypothetical protein